MANSVSMTTQEAIQALHQRGYSKRKISRELGIHRRTFDRYLGKSTEAPPSSGSIP
jgi:IS30 family transposase